MLEAGFRYQLSKRCEDGILTSKNSIIQPARFRICRLINDMFDESKIDVVKMHLNELTYK